MKRIVKTILYGFFIWLIVFGISFIIYPIHDDNRPLFESIMPVALSLVTILFTVTFFKGVTTGYIKEGIRIGLIWLVINIGIDLLMFLDGPMKMTMANYMMDIGLTYLLIPAITIGFGYALSKRSNSNEKNGQVH